MAENGLEQKWQNVFNAEIQKQMWDSKAERYSRKAALSLESSPVLQNLMAGGLRKSDTVLDVGCGAGLYGIAMAPYVRSVTGVDISEKMIRFAREKALEKQCGNCEFICRNWADADLAALGWQKAFDLVFVHMSPAVHDYATFAKLAEASRRRCVFIANTRRTDMVLDSVLGTLGIAGVQEERDRQIPYIFQYLWENGYSPQISYRKEKWQSKYTVREMTEWCLYRAKLQRPISLAEEERLRAQVLREAEKQKHRNAGAEPSLMEEISVTSVTFDWVVHKQP